MSFAVAFLVFRTVTVSFPMVLGYSDASAAGNSLTTPIFYDNKPLRNTHYAKIGEAPFLVSIEADYGNGYSHLCTGILVRSPTTGKQFVITSVYTCPVPVISIPYGMNGEYPDFADPKYYEVAAGLVRLNESYIAQRTKVEQYFVVNPKIENEGHIAHGIMILFIRDFELNDKVQPILWPAPEDEYFGNAKMFGWGQDNTEKAKVQNHLSVVNVPLLDSEVCKQRYKENKDNDPNMVEENFVSDSVICGEFIKDENGLCYSGAPLTRLSKTHGNHVLLGVAMFVGDGCVFSGLPGLISRVLFSMDWILDTVKENGY